MLRALAVLALSLVACTKTEAPAAHDSGPVDAAPAKADDDKVECDKDGRCKVEEISDKTRAVLEARPDRERVTLIFSERTTNEKLTTITKVPWVTSVRLAKAHDVTDLTPLASMTALKELDATGTGVADITPLAPLTTLEMLNLDATKVTDISALQRLTNLTRLYLEQVKFADAAPLAKLTKLKQLSVYGAPATDWSALGHLTELEGAQLNRIALKDATPLGHLKHLTSIHLGWCTELTDVSALKPLDQVTHLVLVDDPVTDISAVSGMARLETLEMQGSKIANLAPLKALRNLRYVTLSDAVTDLSPLMSSVKTLDRLVVPRNTPQERIAPLLQINPRIQVTTAR